MDWELSAWSSEELVAEMFAGFALHMVAFDADVKNVALFFESGVITNIHGQAGLGAARRVEGLTTRICSQRRSVLA